MQELSPLPIYNCTHVQADILKSSHSAFFHCMQISWLVIHQDCLHAALEGTLGGWQQRLEKIPWNRYEKQKRKIKHYIVLLLQVEVNEVNSEHSFEKQINNGLHSSLCGLLSERSECGKKTINEGKWMILIHNLKHIMTRRPSAEADKKTSYLTTSSSLTSNSRPIQCLFIVTFYNHEPSSVLFF